ALLDVVVRARVHREVHDLVLAQALTGDPGDGGGLEEVRAGPRVAEARPVLLEELAHLGGGAVAAVGQDLDVDGGLARPEALVDELLELLLASLARPALDRPLDVLARHVHFAGRLDRVLELQVGVGIGTSASYGRDDGLRRLRERDTLLLVYGGL